MLNPQQQGELLLHDHPPVFGKPWYWQRSSSTMESTRSLALVIMEMRDEIKKLEEENRELRGECGQHSATGGEASKESIPVKKEILENPYGNLRRNTSAPVLEGQYKENTAMTVRRYSTTSKPPELTERDRRIDKSLQSNSGWDRLHEDVFGEEEDTNSQHSLKDFIHKNRAKVKTVTFLLPVDDIYTSRPVLTKHQEESKFTGLASIAETDS
ncbi:PREDICTED: uncharacterized protein LOC107086370 [Cyprinodon variegatus]|uniref:uncharacterized protein LOC107086370 n=1 Tax=Cyprinodon variegatus TaxID=28743 RepID=UPI0007424E80|nr:PREDICTED: uncharacterized protein LOC107086370 [Cyprinodon variegatus]